MYSFRKIFLIFLISIVFVIPLSAEQSAKNLSGKWITLPGEEVLFVPRLRHFGKSPIPLEVCDYIIAVKTNDENIRYFAPRREEDSSFTMENIMNNSLKVKYPEDFFHTIKGIEDPRWLSAYDPNTHTIFVSDHILYTSVEQGSGIIHEFGHLIHFKYIEESKLQYLFDRCLRRYQRVGDAEVYAYRDWMDPFGGYVWQAVDWEMLSSSEERLISSMLFPSVYSSTSICEWWAEIWMLYNIERERNSEEFVFFEINPEIWEFCSEIEELLETEE